jgi:DNA-binding transcriptional ArsR family regulator
MEEERLVVRDVATMRALAHPARVTSMDRLMRVGPATATELGRVAGLTPSAMSYHLRILEKAGLVSTAPGRGDGRERLWQSERTGGWSIDDAEDGTEDAKAVSKELLRSVLAAQELRVNRWLSAADSLEPGLFADLSMLATQAEVEALCAQITALIRQFSPANRPDPPAGAILRRASFSSYPDATDLPEGDVKD